MKIKAEYLWLDGAKPIPHIRSKTKILDIKEGATLQDIQTPEWGFDGSSTEQAEGNSSDCILKPVFKCWDPLRNKGVNKHIIVLNEVYMPGNVPHETNKRVKLREATQRAHGQDFLFGIEQEYTFFKGALPLGFPKEGLPEPQGKYYCGVGADKIYGREIVEEHLDCCLEAGLTMSGVNAEVMPGQWEYQVGAIDPLNTADQLIVARYFMDRIAEKYGVVVSLDPKPKEGDWNGAGAHTNFSTRAMRDGSADFNEIAKKMEANHKEHIGVYGVGNHLRLTGKHETCDIDTFKHGIGDRGASIRIPLHCHQAGQGYLEDRRPASNMNPYEVLAIIMDTVSN
jgi:glutamine synthetase